MPSSRVRNTRISRNSKKGGSRSGENQGLPATNGRRSRRSMYNKILSRTSRWRGVSPSQYIELDNELLKEMKIQYDLWKVQFDADIGFKEMTFQNFVAKYFNKEYYDVNQTRIVLDGSHDHQVAMFVGGYEWKKYIGIPRSQPFTPTFEWWKNAILLDFANLDSNKDNIVSFDEFIVMRRSEDRLEMNIMKEFAALYPDHPISVAFAKQSSSSSWNIIKDNFFWVTKSGADVDTFAGVTFSKEMADDLAEYDENKNNTVTSKEYLLKETRDR